MRRANTASSTGPITRLLVPLDPADAKPLFRQLYAAVRAAVLDGRLARGARLPTTRDFARDLAVSRNTVLQAFEQLAAEGYIEGRVGAGTFVSTSLPDEVLHVRPSPKRRTDVSRPGDLSRRGAALAAIGVSAPRALPGSTPVPFRIGVPDLAAFPFVAWSRIVSRLWREPREDWLAYGDAQGYLPLREEIARYAASARGVRCDASQVIVVSGSQQALDLAARLLLDPDDAVWVEDPGYLGARAAMRSGGARIVPVPVDAEGIDVAAGIERAADARAVYVTPSHQFPLGVAMSLRRRIDLLEWATAARGWIIEDDYDSEYRYAGRPLAALQGLDDGGRVIYVGTFSKVMVPALRLGYVIVPPSLVDAFTRARATADRHAPTVEQAALAEFMREGLFGRHVRRMRVLYEARQRLLVELLRSQLAGVLEVEPSETGMHLAAWLRPRTDDRALAARLARAGLEVAPLSAYRIEPGGRGALLLGFAPYDERAIAGGVARMASVLR